MKLLLRPQLCSPVLSRRLAADGSLARELGAEPNAAVGFLFKKPVSADSPALRSVLAHAEALGERLSFLRNLQFSNAELASCSHLEVVCRKTIAQTDAERRATLEDYRSQALHPTASRWAVRIPQCVYVSKPIPRDAIVHVDQYTGEYAVGTDVSRLLSASDHSGYRLLPVRHWKTRVDRPEIGMHLLSESLWPATSNLMGNEMTSPQRNGLLCYPSAAMSDAPDFGRSAEPWGAWQTPQWIVSQRVRQWVVANGIKGWAFWPVLEMGSALHAEHDATWARAMRLLAGAGARLA